MAKKPYSTILAENKQLRKDIEDILKTGAGRLEEIEGLKKKREEDRKHYEQSESERWETINAQACRINELENLNRSIEERKNDEINGLKFIVELKCKKISAYEQMMLLIAGKVESIGTLSSDIVAGIMVESEGKNE